MHLGERRGWDGLAREDAACRDRPSRSWSEADAGPGRQMGQPPTSVASCSTRSVPSYVPVAVLSLAWRGCCQQLPPTPSPINTRAALSTSTATAIAIANVETSTVPAEDVASVAGRVGACVPSYLEDSRCSRAHCRPLDSGNNPSNQHHGSYADKLPMNISTANASLRPSSQRLALITHSMPIACNEYPGGHPFGQWSSEQCALQNMCKRLSGKHRFDSPHLLGPTPHKRRHGTLFAA
jgi:hypothetical protein